MMWKGLLSSAALALVAGLAPTIVQAADAVRVGALYPLSGQVAKSGEDTANAIRLAAEIINNETDIDLPFAKTAGLPNLGGAKIELLIADHQGNPEIGAAEAERLIVQEKVDALIGAFHSSVAATSSQVAERMNVPFISGESEATSLTERGFKWFFRTTPSSSTQAKDFFTFLREVGEKTGKKIGRVGLVHENTLWGKGFGDAVSGYIAEYPDFELAIDITYQQGTPDVTSEVQRLMAAKPDVVFHASYDAEAILFARTYKQYNFNPRGIMAIGAAFGSNAFRSALDQDANYFLIREHWSRDLARNKAVVAQVGKLYKARYGKDMDGTPARAFTAMMTLADAFNRAGSTEPAKVRDALAATDISAEDMIMPWEGIRFDDKGQNVLTRGIFVQTLEGVPMTVWPFSLAVTDLVWSRPAWR
jgi:branched-chain amino acid transport system substrate-binding protein